MNWDADSYSDEGEPIILTEEQKKFVNHGYLSWLEARKSWAQPLHNTQSSSSSSSSPTSSNVSAASPQQQPVHATNPDRFAPPKLSTPSLLTSTGDGYDSDVFQASSSSSDSGSDDDIDIPVILDCIQSYPYKPFPRPIKLATMVQICSVLWEDTEF